VWSCGSFFGILYSSIKSSDGYLVTVVIHIALGSAGIKPCVSTFGADQFDSADPGEKRQLASFFNWLYFAINLGILISISLVVYLSDYVSWGWGLGSLAIAMGLANLSFFLGTRFYRHCKLASGSPFTRVAQVLVASTRKWRQRQATATTPKTSSACTKCMMITNSLLSSEAANSITQQASGSYAQG
jgi:peptide/histidine transporter 3/4